MAGAHVYTSSIWVSVLTLALLIVLTLFAWQRCHVPAAPQFVVACLFSILWVAGSMAEYLAGSLSVKVFWFKFQVAWQLPTLTALACFVFEYVWPGRWLTRRNLVLLGIAPLITMVLVFTNEFHHLMWSSLTIEGTIAPVRTTLSWMPILYIMALGLAQVGALSWLFLRSPAHRLPATLITMTLLANRGAYLFKRTNHPAAKYLLSDVLFLGMGALAYSIALFGFRLLHPMAQALRTAVDQMSDGMIVVDPEGRIASINPAAEVILGTSLKRVAGQSLEQLLPGWSPEGKEPGSMVMGTGAVSRHVVMQTSDLRDWRGLNSGTVLLLRDVTLEQKAQAQIIEQQRALATLTERERLARELHDSLGQALAAVHLQANTIQRLLQRKQLAEAQEGLQQISDITLAAEVDVREYILGARKTLAGDLPFLVGLRQYMEGYGQRFGIMVELELPPELLRSGLDATTAGQLQRIIQEALTNVRKHAEATRVAVEFSVDESSLRVDIADDGRGFDPAEVAHGLGHGFGLQTMGERAESLGGRLEVSAAPQGGTRVTVTLPLKGKDDDA